jgi:hypothetical protein
MSLLERAGFSISAKAKTISQPCIRYGTQVHRSLSRLKLENTLQCPTPRVRSLVAIKKFFGPQRIDGQLNPVHLGVAAHGYWIQSSVLHIPNRFGFFSPGPPRLQVFHGALFAFISFSLSILSVLGAFIILWVGARGEPNTCIGERNEGSCGRDGCFDLAYIVLQSSSLARL